MYDLLDSICAEALETTMKEYIDFVESISYTKAQVIIESLLNGNEEDIKQVQRIYKNYQS